ncbi:MAG: hypothetical protein FWG68_05835 [Defluviitaleaceae bacterium]|nr:hypothetical protein [Defluviitaleaceae bacterium]
MNIKSSKTEKLDSDLREFFSERRDVPPQVKANLHAALLDKIAKATETAEVAENQQNIGNFVHHKMETWLYLVGFAAAVSLIFSAVVLVVIGAWGILGMLPFGGFPIVILGIGYYWLLSSSAASGLLFSQKLGKRAI